MKVCLFGSYIKTSNGIPSGNNGELLKKILQTQNVEVIECSEYIKTYSAFFKAYVKLFFKHRKLDYDAMIIPWRGILTLPLAKLICRRPIIYFPAFSIYDTLVNDRKKIKPNSLKARIIHLVDKLACKMVDSIILESTAEINYFVKEFSLPREKFHQLPLAADESIFFPRSNEERSNKFLVLYFGTFIPLHGVETIIRSAVILQKYREILFVLCGEGQMKPEIEKLVNENNLDNVKMKGFVPIDKLLEFIKTSDVCLGIFGNTTKSQKVLTNKIYQVLASKKPVITMESPSASEAHLESGVNCMQVPPSCPEKLAEAILFMKDNPEKCQQIASSGYTTYVNYLSTNKVGKQLVSLIKEL